MKRVLVVAYRFPPQTGAGSLRISKFVRYLPEFGWTPEVVTVRNPLNQRRDDTLLAQLPRDLKVHGATGWYWRRLEQRALRWVRGPASPPDPAALGRSDPPDVGGRSAVRRGLARAYGALRDLVEFPDAHVGWVPAAAWWSARACRSRSFDAIFCSTPPHSAQLAAYLAARASGVPLVVDLRDPWADLFHLTRRPVRRFAVRTLERLVFRLAGAVVLNTEAMAEMVRARHTGLPPDRFVAIPNGFDSSDFPARESAPRRDDGRKVVLHVGDVYHGLGDPSEVLRGLETVVARHPALRDRLILRFIGGGPILRTGPYGRLFQESPLRDRIEVLDHQPHAVCVKAMLDASVLFLVQNSPDTPTQVSSKLYEYLYARRPVLAVTTSAATRRVVEETACGVAIPPGRQDEVTRVLESFLTDPAASPHPKDDAVGAYERRALTRRLATILDAVASRELTSRRSNS
ncbi:MAG TPA: glycosyltransferase [Candidatus Polarisedimenticolaceae bacterium]